MTNVAADVLAIVAGFPGEFPERVGPKVRFLARPLPAVPEHRIARDRDGSLAFLFSVVDDRPADGAPPLVLRRVSAEFQVRCRLSRTDDQTTETGVFAVVRCLAPEQSIVEFFVRVCLLLVDLLPRRPRRGDIEQLVTTLVDLFTAAEEPPTRTLVGMWGELFVIARSRQPMLLIDAWRSDPDTKYDFAIPGERLEVKCSLLPGRRHHFSLEQVRPQANLSVVVASIVTERSAGGLSLADLLESVRQLVEGDTHRTLVLEKKIVQTLGTAAFGPLDDAYDDVLATANLRVLKAETVPAPGPLCPPEVDRVSFWADVSRVTPIDKAKLAETGQLAVAVVPGRRGGRVR